MMYLKNWQTNIAELKQTKIELPQFNVPQFKLNGKQSPVWLHFGGGNLYRGFHAEVAQKLANQGELEAGIVVCETFDQEIIEEDYQPFDNNFLEIIMHENGQLHTRLLASTADSLYCHPTNQNHYEQVIHYFENPELQFLTFTITEKGYRLRDLSGKYLPVIEEDIKNGPEKAQHTMSIITALLYKRFMVGELPIAIVSTDNFSQNGRCFKESILSLAGEWVKKDFVPKTFVAYLQDTNKVTFPWSMIDRITPNPSKKIYTELKDTTFTDIEMIQTKQQTNMASFTNTEASHYLVIEDNFPNGRPDLEKAGVILTDRDTVDKTDAMKVTTCLNPLHTALAITGCLLGYTSIADEMRDKDLVNLIHGIGYQEGLPVVEDPGIIDPKKFIDEVVKKRLPNPNIPDTPQRIATDTSQKMAIRFGETIKKYALSEDKMTHSLSYIPVTIAAWLRYLLAIDDKGNAFTPSNDPLLNELQEKLAMIQLGKQNKEQIHKLLMPILANSAIFGSDLYQVGLGEKVEAFFIKMLAGPGAVRQTIHELKIGGNNNGNDV
ncbi:mannitol dehydrogenase family protein [Melissococcus plutonius]|nr:mannitol dehydrogenase family protein [Melissococcus plutonius]MCV2499358.1 mannitol dehydrogenase family protein [Melissococcus plutonius]MCV2501590.1 mannitol dehydrogenase family protein [Melissococcus plutonius]MCV2507878.1 mannitol dehydrogenase family protein [Melissococcus plutonius]